MATPLGAGPARWAGLVGMSVLLLGIALLFFDASLGVILIPAGIVLTIATAWRHEPR